MKVDVRHGYPTIDGWLSTSKNKHASMQNNRQSAASFLMSKAVDKFHYSPPNRAAAIEDEAAGVNPQTVERLVAATSRAKERKFMVGWLNCDDVVVCVFLRHDDEARFMKIHVILQGTVCDKR